MILGITGSIACGKSIVIDYIRNKGYKVISLDDISHELFDDKDINDKIKSSFDIKMVSKVSREEIAKIVFGKQDLLEKLNNILHPLILKQMNEEINKAKSNNEYLFVEVPLLYEASLEGYFDNVILVYANKETQIERLIQRNNLTKEEALIRINSQMDIDEKIKKALKQNHFLIDNNKDLDYTYKATDKILDIINKK